MAYMVHALLFSSQQPCEVGDTDSDWPNVTEEASLPSGYLNLTLQVCPSP